VAARGLVMALTLIGLVTAVSGTSRHNPLNSSTQVAKASQTRPSVQTARSTPFVTRFADQRVIAVAMSLPAGNYLAVSSEGATGRVVVPGQETDGVIAATGFELQVDGVRWYLIREGHSAEPVATQVSSRPMERPFLNRKFDFVQYATDARPLEQTASRVRIEGRR
jgi:hypothetical protein